MFLPLVRRKTFRWTADVPPAVAARPPSGVILFDLDDTLYDHRFACRRALAALRRHYPTLRRNSIAGLEQTYGSLMEKLHPLTLAGHLAPQEARRERIRLLFAAHGESISRVEASRRAALYRSAYLHAERAVPGARAVVRELCLRGHRVGVVTNNSVRGQRRKLVIAGIAPFVRTLVISQAVGFSKPDPRIFRIALRRVGGQPAHAVMVGDSWERDVLGARVAGISAVWFNRGGRPRPRGARLPELRSWTPVRVAVTTLVRALR